MKKTLEALDIILSSPLWPNRENLSVSGQALFDSLVTNARVYALDCVNENYAKALETLVTWGKLTDQFIEETFIGSDESNNRLLSVFLYYANVIVIWDKLESGALVK